MLAITLAGCSSQPPESQRGTLGFVEGFLGGVAADEPRAALIGRDVLSSGGSAVDAAVAMYFALSVTLPSSAGLGGGGACVVWDRTTPKTGKVEAIDFRALAGQETAPTADRPSAIPANPRGFFALHSRYGRLRWSQLVGPAENLARFGAPVTRSFARDLLMFGPALVADPEARRIFARRDGSVLQEGDMLQQIDLAAILGRIRTQGPGELYVGPVARQFVDAALRAGGTASIEDLRQTMPQWRETVAVKVGNDTAHFAPLPGGIAAAQIWGMLNRRGSFARADAATRSHLLADAAMLAYADRAQWMANDGSLRMAPAELVAEARLDALAGRLDPGRHLSADRLPAVPMRRPENPFATSFVALDRDANAVACAVTMNYLFGTGRVAPGTGMLLAARPGSAGRGAESLSPMLVVNHNVREFIFAGSSSGGLAAPTALTAVAARTLFADQPLEEALAAPRVHHSGEPDRTFHEAQMPPDITAALAAKGHTLAPAGEIGLVNAIACPRGLPPKPESCVTRPDQRRSGLALAAD